jgi:hypothetical protein
MWRACALAVNPIPHLDAPEGNVLPRKSKIKTAQAGRVRDRFFPSELHGPYTVDWRDLSGTRRMLYLPTVAGVVFKLPATSADSRK